MPADFVTAPLKVCPLRSSRTLLVLVVVFVIVSDCAAAISGHEVTSRSNVRYSAGRRRLDRGSTDGEVDVDSR